MTSQHSEALMRLVTRFRASQVLGQGGMGTVRRGTHPSTGRPCALKTIRGQLERTMRGRFLREARAAAAVRHPNLVEVLDSGEEDDVLWIAFELVEGQELGTRVNEGRPEPDCEVLRNATVQLSGALEALHRAGLVHRDVKPANVLVDDQDRAVLVDLGLAFDTEATRYTATQQVVGTPYFIAPEGFRAEPATPVFDWYALGVTLYICLSRRAPWNQETFLAAVAQGEAPPADPLDPAIAATPLGRLTVALMAPDPAARPDSEAAVRATLDAGSGPEPSTPRPASRARPAERSAGSRPPPRSASPPAPRRSSWVSGLVAGVLLGAGAAWLAWPTRAPGPATPLPSSPRADPVDTWLEEGAGEAPELPPLGPGASARRARAERLALLGARTRAHLTGTGGPAARARELEVEMLAARLHLVAAELRAHPGELPTWFRDDWRRRLVDRAALLAAGTPALPRLLAAREAGDLLVALARLRAREDPRLGEVEDTLTTALAALRHDPGWDDSAATALSAGAAALDLAWAPSREVDLPTAEALRDAGRETFEALDVPRTEVLLPELDRRQHDRLRVALVASHRGLRLGWVHRLRGALPGEVGPWLLAGFPAQLLNLRADVRRSTPLRPWLEGLAFLDVDGLEVLGAAGLATTRPPTGHALGQGYPEVTLWAELGGFLLSTLQRFDPGRGDRVLELLASPPAHPRARIEVLAARARRDSLGEEELEEVDALVSRVAGALRAAPGREQALELGSTLDATGNLFDARLDTGDLPWIERLWRAADEAAAARPALGPSRDRALVEMADALLRDRGPAALAPYRDALRVAAERPDRHGRNAADLLDGRAIPR